jgi:hypothetical protein
MAGESQQRAPIGVWIPGILNGEEVFTRPDPGPLGDDWSPRKYLSPRRGPLPLRVCLIGESTAAGFFYAPHLTPALVLEDQLKTIRGSEAYEVIDLTRVDMPADGSLHDLVRVTVAALQLDPDVLVIFAGNNWLTQFKPFAKSGPDHIRSFSPAYQETGVRGIMEQCDQNTRSHCAGVVKNLSYIASTVPVPMILVVPEVNQSDWVRGWPGDWLAGNRTADWHKLYAKALAIKKNRHSPQPDLVGSIAEQMVERDEGTCPISARMLAEARLAQERTSDAREMFIHEIDSAGWHSGALPGAGSTVRELLRSAAENPHITCVDLPKIFFEQTAGIPGRRMFLDYCHLTLEGIKVAMAAVASQVLRLTGAPEEQCFEYRSLLPMLPEPEIHPARDALAKFLAALYTVHWERRFDGESLMPQYWCEAAINTWGGIQETMLDYVATLIPSPSVFGLSVAEQHFFGGNNSLEDGSHMLAGEGRRLQRFSLDPRSIELICSVLERSGRPVRDSINQRLMDQHGIANGRGRVVDLVNPYYHWTTMDHLIGFQSDSHTYSGYGLYQAFWSSSDFCFVSDATSFARIITFAR